MIGSNEMNENGDSWEYKATTGDYKLWLNGGQKQEGQDLGVLMCVPRAGQWR